MAKTISISVSETENKTFNTYATVEDADNYFVAKFGSEWETIGATQKPQLLISATRFIDTKNYIGMPVEENQPLKFPRLVEQRSSSPSLANRSPRFVNGEDVSYGPITCELINHPYYGKEVIQTSDETLLIACCELAELIYKNNGIGANTSNISSVSMGDSSISFKNNTSNENEIDQLVYQYLKDYMRGNVGIVR